jgi:hypothetical protein
MQCVLAARILTVDFVVCTLAVQKKSWEVLICRIGPFPCKLHAERQHKCGKTLKNLSAEYVYDYRERKTLEEAQENKTPQASISTDPTPAPIVYSYNQANEFF